MHDHFKYFNSDDRSQFANQVLGLLYLKYNGDIRNIDFINELKKLCDHLEEHVRNIYECIDEEIPLMALNNVLNDGAKGYSEWEEYTDEVALKVIEQYCYQHYGTQTVGQISSI